MMNSHSKVAEAQPADLPIVSAIADALVERALPGEVGDFNDEERREAASFVAELAQRRPAGIALVRVESVGGSVGHRRMRIGIINDDMPFLVDSIANALAARDLIIHRLLHPVVAVERDPNCCLVAVRPRGEDEANHESIMYLEVDRVDARGRRELVAELHRVLADVRSAVCDWRAMQSRMREDAEAITDPEGAALLRWFADGSMTLLGFHVERPDQSPQDRLGIFKLPGAPRR